MSTHTESVSVNTWVSLGGGISIDAKAFPSSGESEFTFAGMSFGMTMTEEALEICCQEFNKILAEIKNSANESEEE